MNNIIRVKYPEIFGTTEQDIINLCFQRYSIFPYVKHQIPDICLAACTNDGNMLKYVKVQTEALCLVACQNNIRALKYVKNGTEDFYVKICSDCIYALQYIKPQTEKICIAAISIDNTALYYVENQTTAICKASIKKYPRTLYFVREQTPEICLLAYNLDDYCYRFIDWNTMVSYHNFTIQYAQDSKLKEIAHNICLNSQKGSITFGNPVGVDIILTYDF